MSTSVSQEDQPAEREPSEAIKERLIEDFKEFTGIERKDDMSEDDKREMATDFLSQVEWNIQRAVENYLIVFGSSDEN